MSQSRDIHFTLFDYSVRLITSGQHVFRRLLHPLTAISLRASSSELLMRIEQATRASQLTQKVNKLQDLLWNLPSHEQTLQRTSLISALNVHVLESSNTSLRLEAASWLRMLLQAGLVTHPEEVFVTLVTATCRATLTKEHNESSSEQQAYLKLIFDCFWPFRYPYAALERDLFPANSVFYPLAPLVKSDEYGTQEMLIAIFAELPELDDAEIVQYLLPIALAWASSANAEQRGRVSNILARMSDAKAQEALCRLHTDVDATVRGCAKRAAENTLKDFSR